MFTLNFRLGFAQGLVGGKGVEYIILYAHIVRYSPMWGARDMRGLRN